MKKYLISVFCGMVCMLLVAAVVNFTVDPSAIYLRDLLINSKFELIAKVLKKSAYGITGKGLDDYKLKLAMAKNLQGVDCAIVGSSHALQISKLRSKTNPIPMCSNLTNLAVSGMGLREATTILYTISTSRLPKKLFVSIDPWLFQYKIYGNWNSNIVSYFRIYDEAKRLGGVAKKRYYDDVKEKIINIISYDYFYQSLKMLNKYGIRKILNGYMVNVGDYGAKSYLSPRFNPVNGYVEGVYWPDGSYVYNSNYISGKHSMLPNNYHLDNKRDYVNKDAVDMFFSILNFIKNQGVKVYIILEPYSQAVISDRHSRAYQSMAKLVPVINRESVKFNINVYGTYNPYFLGCSESDFFNYMHAKIWCVNKIFRYYNRKKL